MNKYIMKMNMNSPPLIITAGDTYLDIDAYACMVALTELLQLQGIRAVAYSTAPCNYSVCESLITEGKVARALPTGFSVDEASYVIVDVSDPDYIKGCVPPDRVIAVYDHHVGFEQYWVDRIGEDAQIEFIGAAATLIFREWEKAGLLHQMTRSSALLLIAAILDNTLNLTSSNTTSADIKAFEALCRKENIDHDWCASYFSQVQANVEADLHNALFNDMKTVLDNEVLPTYVAQLCVWDAWRILDKLDEIRTWFASMADNWMINIIDLRQRCGYFVCDDGDHQNKIERVFDVRFEAGVAKTPVSYLRKQIIKKTRAN